MIFPKIVEDLQDHRIDNGVEMLLERYADNNCYFHGSIEAIPEDQKIVPGKRGYVCVSSTPNIAMLCALHGNRFADRSYPNDLEEGLNLDLRYEICVEDFLKADLENMNVPEELKQYLGIQSYTDVIDQDELRKMSKQDQVKTLYDFLHKATVRGQGYVYVVIGKFEKEGSNSFEFTSKSPLDYQHRFKIKREDFWYPVRESVWVLDEDFSGSI